jgi:DNA-directed RNA polymerase subunit RPC12/RpoP
MSERKGPYYQYKGKKYPSSERWKKENPERYAQYQRDRYLQKTYGITSEKFDRLVAAQDNKCAICRKEFTNGWSINIDHNHKTSKVRGLLCPNCNRALGLFKDDVRRLKRAVQYVLGDTNVNPT